MNEVKAKLEMLSVLAQYVPLALAVLEDDVSPHGNSRKSSQSKPGEVRNWTVDHYRDFVHQIETQPLLQYSLWRLARQFKDLDPTSTETCALIQNYLQHVESNPQGFRWCLLNEWALEIQFHPAAERSPYHDDLKITCLAIAVHNRAYSAVRSLVELRVNIDGVDQYSENSALQTAALADNNHMLDLLIDCGANVNFSGGHFGTALQCAACDGHEDATRILAARGARVNREGGLYSNALMATACIGNVAVAKMLVDFGTFPVTSDEIQNALELVEQDQLERVISALISTFSSVYGSQHRITPSSNGSCRKPIAPARKIPRERGAPLLKPTGAEGSIGIHRTYCSDIM